MPKYYNKSTKKWEDKPSSSGSKNTKTIKSAFMTKDEMIAKKAKMERDSNKGAGSNIKTSSSSYKKKQSDFKKSPGSGYQAGKDRSITPGSNIKTSSGPNYNVGESKGGVSFNKAYKHFKDKGAKEFTWNGKRYNTK